MSAYVRLRRVCCVVNRMEDVPAWHLAGVSPLIDPTATPAMPKDPENYDLIVLWSYRKVIKGITDLRNVVLFHSSDLPAGRGWAPIYHAITSGAPRFTICGIRASEPVDSGDILIRASFPMRPEYTARYLRRWDEQLSLDMASVLAKRDVRRMQGLRQEGAPTWRERRRPEDNEVLAGTILGDWLLTTLRACEPRNPAWLIHEGVRFNLTLEPAEPPPFPQDVRIEVFE